MNKEELAKLLKATFQQELHDHIGSLTRELLAMESDQSREQKAESWQIIFRVAHTLKGASAIVKIDSIGDACHSMEEIFSYYRDKLIAMPEEMTSLMLKTVDGFSEIAAQLQSGSESDQSTLADILPELKRLADEARHRDEPLPADSDDVAFVFNEPEPVVTEEAEADLSQLNPSEVVADQQPEKPVASRQNADSTASVRVSAQKLDSLLSHSGELLIARGRMALRLKDALCPCSDSLRSRSRQHRRCLD